MTHLITGATGQVGRATLQALLARGEPVRAAVRGPDHDLGSVPTVRLDFEDPGTWDDALRGVRRVFLLRPPPISDVGPTLNAFVDHGAAQLERVVFLSVAGAEHASFIPHAKVEAHLRAGSVPWTFLRAGFFSHNVLTAYRRDVVEDDRLYVPAGAGRASWVDVRDLGEAAAIALCEPGAQRQAWSLTGPEACGFHEVAAILTRLLGRTIRYVPASIPGFVWHRVRRRGDPLAAAIVYTALHTALRFGSAEEVDPTLQQVLGRRPRTIEQTLVDHLDALRPARV